MLKKIIEIDKYLFLKINRDAQNVFFDAIMPFCRTPIFWVPLYLFIVLFVFFNFKKQGWAWGLAAIVTAAITDLVSSHIIKPLVARPRPCMDIDFSNSVRLLASYCGGNGSFTSSHAANHFGLAMFFFITLRQFFPKTVYLFFLWAAVISFAQVYVGVHYPTDIAAGAMLGLFIGWVVAKYFNSNYFFKSKM